MAVMWDLIIKNPGITDIDLEDLGITVDATSQIDFASQFVYEDIASSDDLRVEVLAGNLVINNGTSDLSASDGNEYLEIVNVWFLKYNHYTKTEMQTSGSSQLHWDNITNAPSFGFSWDNPVLARSVQISSTPPVAPADGDFYIDTDDDQLYKYDGTTWVSAGAPTTGDRVITLDSTSENIFQWSGSAWEDQGTPTDNDTVMVNDDGDGDPSIYVYDLPQLTWIKIADASVITGDHNTLNGAYDEGGAGVGRTITVDAAPVKLDATSGSDAPLELTNLSSAPTTNLANGQLAVVGGILYAYDSTRTKWLSVQRETFAFGRRGSSKDQWINHYAGTLASNNSGLRVMRNATIVGLAGQLDGSGTCDMRIRKNDVLVDITTLSIAAATGAQDTTIDVDLSAGDFLQCYIENSTSVSDPMIVVEIAWRV